MTDPVRGKIFFALAEESRSVAELALELDEPGHRVRYHVKQLVAQGLVGEAGQRPQRFYALQTPIISSGDAAKLDHSKFREISVQILNHILADATAALTTRTFTRRADWATVRLPAEVDEVGWKDLVDIHKMMTAETQDIIRRSGERLRSKSNGKIRVEVALLLFDYPRRVD